MILSTYHRPPITAVEQIFSTFLIHKAMFEKKVCFLLYRENQKIAKHVFKCDFSKNEFTLYNEDFILKGKFIVVGTNLYFNYTEEVKGKGFFVVFKASFSELTYCNEI